MRIAALIGLSATGKSKIGLEIFKSLSDGEEFHGWVFGTLHKKEKIAVIGNYTINCPFKGADRLNPRAATGEFKIWLRNFYRDHPDWNIFFESNILGGWRVLSEDIPDGVNLRVYCTTCSRVERVKRHRIRGSGKEKNFDDLEKGLQGQLDRVKKLLPESWNELPNENRHDSKKNAALILKFLRG